MRYTDRAQAWASRFTDQLGERDVLHLATGLLGAVDEVASNRWEAAVERAGFRVDRATYGFATVFPLFVVERTARKARGARAHGPVDVVEVPRVPRLLNTALVGLSRLDEAVLRRGDLPFGSSVFVAATRPD